MPEGPSLPFGPGRMPVANKGAAAFGLPLVCALTAMAGSVDSCGVAVLKDLYVSFMSGNTTALGRALAGAEWSRVGLITAIISAFVAGVVAGTILARLAGIYRLPAVTFAVGIILALFDPFSATSIPFLCFAMGALNAALQQLDGMTISITYVTGALVKLGQGIAQFVCGDTRDWRWLEQAALWCALLLGVTMTAVLQSMHPGAVRVVLPLAALVVSATTFVAVRRAQGRQDR
jgi:uncharacterized membrane protein YoaK (UPF0700 family)